MANKLSTGLVNALAGGKNFREVLADCVLDIYDGNAGTPTYADDAALGTKLLRVTKASGAIVVGTSDRSTARIYKLVPAGYTTSNTIIVNVTVDGVGPTSYTYVILAADDSVIKVAVKVARMLNDIPQIEAIPEGDSANIWLQGAIPGLDLTIADGSGTTAIAVTAKQAAARVNTLQFGAPSVGAISKLAAETWSGVGLATGVAAYARFVNPGDGAALSLTDIRVQLVIAPSGSDLDMPNPNITLGATTTIDNYTLTVPKVQT